MIFEYRNYHFENREDELNKVLSFLDQVKKRATATRTLVFHSESGTGKTFFSFHLNRTVFAGEKFRLDGTSHPVESTYSFLRCDGTDCKVEGVQSFLLCLGPAAASEDAPLVNEYFANQELAEIAKIEDNDKRLEKFQELIKSILKKLKAYIGSKRDEDPELKVFSGYMIADVKSSTEKAPLVLIVDSVFEQEWDFLRELESFFLAPMASLPQVMIILTGRGRMYPWESPQLQTLVEVHKDMLKPFIKAEQIEQQIGSLNIQEVNTTELVRVSKGNPKLNRILAIHGVEAEGLELALDEFLGTEASLHRKYLVPLAVWDGFRQEEIIAVLKADDEKGSYENMSRVQIRREIIDPLIKTQFVRWEDGQWRMDETLKNLIQEFLCLTDLERWKRLNQAAIELYQEFVKELKKQQKDTGFFDERLVKYREQLKREC